MTPLVPRAYELLILLLLLEKLEAELANGISLSCKVA